MKINSITHFIDGHTHLDTVEVKSVKTGKKWREIRITSDDDIGIVFLGEKEVLPDGDIDILRLAAKLGEGKVIDDIFDFFQDDILCDGIFINSTWYDFDKIQCIFE